MTRHPFRFARHSALVAATLATTAAAPALAQGTGGQAQGSQPTTPPIDFSGVIFGNYNVRTDSAAKAATGGKAPNQFTIERVYLTFRMPVGNRASIRATTDIFQNTNSASNSFYAGWVVRLKYGYLQYNFLNDIGGHKGFNALGRIGMLHTVVIDHEEGFWPRYLSQTGVERFGFFSSADLGVATQVSLPGKFGEVYGTITNGPGYTSAETDRFKDFAARLSITPFGKQTGWLQTFTISPWVYRGLTASRYANGGTGQVGPVTEGVARNRWGIFAGVKDPRLTLAAHYARRTEGFEPANANTPAVARTVIDSTGSLISVYGIARPVTWTWAKNTAHLGVVARWDRFTPRTALTGSQQLVIAGLQLEPSARTALTLDYQSLAPEGYAANAPIAQTRITPGKTWFLHWSATF